MEDGKRDFGSLMWRCGGRRGVAKEWQGGLEVKGLSRICWRADPRVCFSLGMSIHLSDSVVAELPQQLKLLSEVSVRLLEPSEGARFDELLSREHYLKNATVVGQTLRYLAEHQRP